MSRRRQLFFLQCFGVHWLLCQANGFPLTREPMISHSPFEVLTNRRAYKSTHPIKTNRRSRTITALTPLAWRGGAAMASSAASWTQRIVSSSTACWIVLILTVILESSATSISKQSRDMKSKRLFAVACVLYLLRYVCVCVSLLFYDWMSWSSPTAYLTLKAYSMWGFNLSLAQVPVGIAYAVWSALGTTLVTTMGILHFGETMNWKKAICLLLIVSGVVGLNV